MNKKTLFFIVSLIIQSYNARYPDMRIVKDCTPKTIIVTNKTDQNIFVRLKPTHIHPACASCNDLADHQEKLDNCCKSIKIIEYNIPAHTTQPINLNTINVGSPDDQDNKEYLDFTHVIYAKIYNASRKHYKYITLEDNQHYTILSAENSISVSVQ